MLSKQLQLSSPYQHKNPKFRELQNAILSCAYWKGKIDKLTGQLLPGEDICALNRKIKPKMLKKLMKWMEKVCFETLQFTFTTYQLAVRILFSYLVKVDDEPSELQLLGCVSLHIASKVHEKTIIAIESYENCCCGLFNNQTFQQKEQQLYYCLHFDIQLLTTDKIINFLTNRSLISEQSGTKAKKLCIHLLKFPQLWSVPLLEITIWAVCWHEEQNDDEKMDDTLQKMLDTFE